VESTRRVAVVGAGHTGASWAGLFAAHGCSVTIYDPRQEAALRGIERAREAARFLLAKGLAEESAGQRGLQALAVAPSLEEAAARAELVQECVPDDVAVKRAVFAALSRVAPDEALLATSSSGLSISAVQRDAYLPGRTLAAHPYNPPHLVPLVELAAGALTDPASIDLAAHFYRSLGKEVVVVNGDVPGYIANRLSAALWREAIDLVRTGVATVEDVDRAVRCGPGLRWAAMGPHLIYHLGGGSAGIRGHVAHLTETKEGMLRDLATWTTFPPETAELLERGLEAETEGRSLEELEAQRDEVLVALLKALRTVPSGSPAGGALSLV
jgi:carnitine 3-dehydrogenase